MGSIFWVPPKWSSAYSPTQVSSFPTSASNWLIICAHCLYLPETWTHLSLQPWAGPCLSLSFHICQKHWLNSLSIFSQAWLLAFSDDGPCLCLQVGAGWVVLRGVINVGKCGQLRDVGHLKGDAPKGS